MYILSLIATPGRLDGALAEKLRADWSGGALHWLHRDGSVEFAVSARPTDLSSARDALHEQGMDLNCIAAAGRAKRLLIADMDSTLIGQECIDELADAAGVGPEVAAVTEAAMRGELDFEGALRERVARLEGLSLRVVEEVLQDRISLMAGARQLIATMGARGASTHLVSGGFTIFAAAIAANLGMTTHSANRLEIIDGHLTGRVHEPILGREAKAEALIAETAARGLTPADAVAIGDGANDLAMIGAAGLGVAYRAKPITAAKADARIHHGDLTAVLYLQGIEATDFAL